MTGVQVVFDEEATTMSSNQARTNLFVLLFALGMAADSFAQPLGQWRFDENSGAVATDSVGANHGALNGDATFVPGGIVGNAVSMTKAGNGYVEIGDIFPMTSGDLSIVVWFKTNPGDQQPDFVFVAKHEAGSTNGYLLGVNTTSGLGQTDKAFLLASSSGWVEIISTTSVNDGAWHQFVTVYRESGLAELYLDGNAEASGPGGPVIGSTAPFMVGGVNFSGVPGGVWDGQVDELQVYGHALSSGEIQSLFEFPASTLIFGDDFESGDTSRWSSTQ